MKVEIYSEKHKTAWNNFVTNSKNGTFLFHRDFMEYHADRFNDFSLLFYNNKALIALLPANINDKILYSHQGLTYGGLIMSKDIKTIEVKEIFEYLVTSLRQQGIKEIIYKAIPHIYHAIPSEEDLYALSINLGSIVGRGISSTILLNKVDSYSAERRRGIKRAQQQNLSVEQTTDYTSFWNILEDNLRKRYQAKPVHSVEEMELLHKRFSDNIQLWGVYNNRGIMIAGAVLFITTKVVHLQYIASSDEGKEKGATDILIDRILHHPWSGQAYFDYGISTENNGLYLNEGLIRHKEGFGARGIVYDIYSIKLS